MTPDDAVADRTAVVLVVEAERIEARFLEEALHDLREPVEGVFEVLRHVRVAKARVVRGKNVETLGEGGDQVAELMR